MSPSRFIDQPPVSIIVPVAGCEPGAYESLRSVILQDYGSYEVIYVTDSPDDESVPVIARIVREASEAGTPSCRHVVGGISTGCGQKNHNLLAGVREIYGDCRILVFFDSLREARHDWLRTLIGPIIRAETEISTGYHHILPRDFGTAVLGRTVTVLALYQMQKTAWLRQPWGGNTAIAVEAFERLGIERLWSTNVVDDVSLAARLRETGSKVASVERAVLSTPLGGQRFSQWIDWETRQWLYLKFCFPGTWAIGGLVAYLTSALILSSVLVCIGALMHLGPLGTLGPPTTALPALLFLTLLGASGWALRRSHPSPLPFSRWLAALFAAVFIASLSHFKTWFARDISWRGVRYRVSWKGKVLDVVRS